MEWDFEKIQESVLFSLENKAQIDRDLHFQFFELVSSESDGSGKGSFPILVIPVHPP